jgi:uncharacterized protein YaeQ
MRGYWYVDQSVLSSAKALSYWIELVLQHSRRLRSATNAARKKSLSISFDSRARKKKS